MSDAGDDGEASIAGDGQTPAAVVSDELRNKLVGRIARDREGDSTELAEGEEEAQLVSVAISKIDSVTTVLITSTTTTGLRVQVNNHHFNNNYIYNHLRRLPWRNTRARSALVAPACPYHKC